MFNISKIEELQISRFVTFGALIYIKSWIVDPLAAEAPGGDLKLWMVIKAYEAIDQDCKESFRATLWYLSEELVI